MECVVDCLMFVGVDDVFILILPFLANLMTIIIILPNGDGFLSSSNVGYKM